VFAAEEFPRQQMKLFELGEESRVEEQLRGRGDRRQSARS
jgi:hypothetical protein